MVSGSTGKEKWNIKLRKETYGDMPLEECLKKALDPYFNPEKHDNPYLKRLENINYDTFKRN